LPIQTPPPTEPTFTADELEHAFVTQALTFHLQPVVSLRTGDVQSFEALVRWEHPQAGLLEAKAFIKTVADGGFSPRLTPLCVQFVARFRQRAAALGLRPLPVAMNITASEFEAPDFAARFIATLKQWGTPAEGVKLEMLEWDKAHDLAQVSSAVDALNAAGVQVVLDDFGHAYGSFHRMMSIHYTGIKLDSVYANALGEEHAKGLQPRAAAIVSAMVGMTQQLGMDLVIEGVQTQSQADALQLLGVTRVQGRFYYPPAPLDAALTLLAALPQQD
jgi:EAL domain-containing protein (putative c-di-GMP-specific phosphodiesterase class I)